MNKLYKTAIIIVSTLISIMSLVLINILNPVAFQILSLSLLIIVATAFSFAVLAAFCGLVWIYFAIKWYKEK